MQALKEKISDLNATRKAKADAKAEEKAEKEVAKARVDVAHEVRLAREAEAQMGLHMSKAGQRIEREIAKQGGDGGGTNVETADGNYTHNYPSGYGAHAGTGTYTATGNPQTYNATENPQTTQHL